MLQGRGCTSCQCWVSSVFQISFLTTLLGRSSNIKFIVQHLTIIAFAKKTYLSKHYDSVKRIKPHMLYAYIKRLRKGNVAKYIGKQWS